MPQVLPRGHTSLTTSRGPSILGPVVVSEGEEVAMRLIGFLLLMAGGVMSLLVFTGIAGRIPALEKVSLPLGVWVGMVVIGGVMVMLTRQTRD